MRTTITLLMCTSFALWTLGCASQPELRPAPDAHIEKTSLGSAPTDTVQGVTVVAKPNAWRWTPTDLNKKLTPVLVRVENGSGHELLLRYDGFRLVTGRGVEYAALPPFNIKGKVSQEIGYAYNAPGFYVAPRLHPWYPAFGVWEDPFFYGPYYSAYYPLYVQFELPTQDMLTRALPEGVLDPQGRITGFVYFPDLDAIEPQPTQVRLQFTLIDAKTRRRFGVISIPFKVVDK